tara:strand:- start:82224 stop:82436 length:213 start_codon:yes stop_codon:yes gene_type:complete
MAVNISSDPFDLLYPKDGVPSGAVFFGGKTAIACSAFGPPSVVSDSPVVSGIAFRAVVGGPGFGQWTVKG